VASRTLKERLRAARQLNQTIPGGTEQPALASMSLKERLRAPRQPVQTIREASEQPTQKVDVQTVHEEAETVANGHVEVANKEAVVEEVEPATDGHAQVADEEAAHADARPATKRRIQVANEEAAHADAQPATKRRVQVANGGAAHTEAEPAANGQVQVANEEAPHKEAEPGTNGHVQLADELEQVARESAQTPKADERLPSQFSQSINDALTRRQTLPGFADPRLERISAIELPPWFIDRCRSAYLSVAFEPATDCRVIGVTSAAYGEGKTSVAIGIATAMAVDTKKPTLLIECDFAAPSFYRFFGVTEAGGLSDWLGGGSRLRIVRGAAAVPNMFVIPSGSPQKEPARFFYQLVDRNVFEGLRGLFGNVVIDLPPVLHISYGSLACALADRLLIVARSKLTLTSDLETMVTRIGKDRVSGIVLTGAEDRVPSWLRNLL
jgi:Mrp family chromosome partitioning ATPase